MEARTVAILMTTDIAAAAEEMVEVTTFAEVSEGLRAESKLAVVLDDHSRPIRAGTVLRLDGKEHTRRRRLLNRLVFRGEHARFRRAILGPALERQLAAAPRAPDGLARADLVELCMRSLLEHVAALIGLDPVVTRERIDELARLQADVEGFLRLGTQLKAAAPPLPDGDAGLRRAIARLEVGKREFAERFFRPALADRRRAIARHEAGEIAESELPNDLLTLVALHLEPGFDEDGDLPLREAVTDFLHAGTGTSVGAIVHAMEHLALWFERRPEDRARAGDVEFLHAVVNETLRLHSANPAEVRRAVEDVRLSGGTTIRAGQYVALRTGVANRDASVFGRDAAEFDPRRTIPPGVSRYGLAFGAGPHMCYGVPVAMGDEGTDGSLVLVVKRLLEAGVRKDADRPARYRPGIAYADLRGWESYPVVLT